MCGFSGFYSKTGELFKDDIGNTIVSMLNQIIHRGPDSYGTWIESNDGIALGHRRLAIIDLSPEGHQPMHSISERYVIVFNGEIYNYQDLKKRLVNEAPVYNSKFRGNSDTEVMLACIEQWGIEKAVQQFTGMFAFALWDKKEKDLYLVRDRMGEKPLYYGWNNGVFLFGSELKSLVSYPNFRKEINRDALTLYLRHNYIPAPYSIYENIFKLNPGCILKLDTRKSEISINSYWSMSEVISKGITSQIISEDEAFNELEYLLRDSVKQQMLSDVPLGAFLSGGVDSSTIVALMQAQSNRPVKTFSIGFHEEGYNEAEFAKAVAKHIGTDHTEMYVTSKEALDVIPKIPDIYDEPFSDSSQIPTFLVSKLAKQNVTVSLSGDAGDELFGGYSRYSMSSKAWDKLKFLPTYSRIGAAKLIKAIDVEVWNKTLGWTSPILGINEKSSSVGDKLNKVAEVIGVPSYNEFYQRMVSHWKNPSEVVINGREPSYAFNNRDILQNRKNKLDIYHQMMYLDSITYLPDDILVKVDRAAMKNSLETRVPLLDHRIVELSWRIPLSMKVRNGEGKWILRQLLYKYVPRELIDRPKKGFGVPIDQWLRGPLREWSENLLDRNKLLQQGFFEPKLILEKWEEHKTGKRNWGYYLWDILMFQAWLEKQNL